MKYKMFRIFPQEYFEDRLLQHSNSPPPKTMHDFEFNNLVLLDFNSNLTEQLNVKIRKSTPNANTLFKNIENQVSAIKEYNSKSSQNNIYDKIKKALERKLGHGRYMLGMNAKEEIKIKDMIETCRQRKHFRPKQELDRALSARNRVASARNYNSMNAENGRKATIETTKYSRPQTSRPSSARPKTARQSTERSSKDLNNQHLILASSRLIEKAQQLQQIDLEQSMKKSCFKKQAINSSNNKKYNQFQKQKNQSQKQNIVSQNQQSCITKTTISSRSKIRKLQSPYSTSSSSNPCSFLSPSTSIQPSQLRSANFQFQQFHEETSQTTSKIDKVNESRTHRHRYTDTMGSSMSNVINQSTKRSSKQQRNGRRYTPKTAPMLTITHRFNNLLQNCQNQKQDIEILGRKIGHFQYFCSKMNNKKSNIQKFCKKMEVYAKGCDDDEEQYQEQYQYKLVDQNGNQVNNDQLQDGQVDTDNDK